MIKFAFVGPESTGKTTLSSILAKEFSGVYVPEFAREYVAILNRPYTLNDIDYISIKQLESEAESIVSNAAKLLFCDTSLLVNKIWAINSFGASTDFIDYNYHPNSYHFHFLCDVDLPWEYDPLREHPNIDDRKYLFKLYELDLLKSNANYKIISGNLDARLKTCRQIINELLVK